MWLRIATTLLFVRCVLCVPGRRVARLVDTSGLCNPGDEVWNASVIGQTDEAKDSSCGKRIEALQLDGKSEKKARAQVALEFPSICGACVQGRDRQDKRIGELTNATCESVWNDLTTDANGTMTCGQRIKWLRKNGVKSRRRRRTRRKRNAETNDESEETVTKAMSKQAAGKEVARLFPEICGPCKNSKKKNKNNDDPEPTPAEPTPNPVAEPTPNPSKAPTKPPTPNPTESADGLTCADVWNTPAPDENGDWPCGDRIEYLQREKGYSLDAAKLKVGREEIPDVCGPCADEVEQGGGQGANVPSNPPVGVDEGFSVVTQNLYWWRLFGQLGGGNFFSRFGRYKPYDVMLLQECNNAYHIVNGLGLGGEHSVYQAQHALAITWNKNRFQELEKGFREVGEDKPGLWGKRGVAWARLKDRQSDLIIWVASHHGPLPINTGGRTGGRQVASNIMALINDTSKSGDAVLIAGDFNADTGSSTVAGLKEAGLRLRESDWVDHIFTRSLGDGRTEIIRDTGSDHRGIKISF